MLYKLGTLGFMASTTIFAALYFNVDNTTVLQALPEINAGNKDTSQSTEKTVPNTKINRGKTTASKNSTPSKTVYPGSQPDLSAAEIDLMLEICASLRRRHSHGLKKQHPILFQRLQLDEETEEQFQLLIGERRMIKTMRPDKNASNEDKQRYEERKEELLAGLDDKISDVISDKFENYLNYREKPAQYQHVARINAALEVDNAELNTDQQDQLASMMHTSRQNAKHLHEDVDWHNLHETPVKADEILDDYKERIEVMIANADQFLDETQRTAFEHHLDSGYERFSRFIQRSKSPRRRRRH